MANNIKELSDKLDLILKQQEVILKHLQISLENSEPLSTSYTVGLNKKQEEERFQYDLTQVIFNSHRLKAKFNLAATPQFHRVIKYLETRDPSVFDGLKRKS